MRRRGYTPEAIRAFCDRIGVAKRENVVDVALLEHAVREDLNRRASRVMAVLNPLRVVIENYPEGQTEEFEIGNNPEDAVSGLAQSAFLASPVHRARRLHGGAAQEVFSSRAGTRGPPPRRLFRHVHRHRQGHVRRIIELRCVYDPATRGGDAPDGRKVKATLHWVSAQHAIDAEVRLYDRLFNSETPGVDGDYHNDLNPHSLDVRRECKLEPSIADAPPGSRYQFERLGYFCVDPDSTRGALVFNRTVTLKDSWAKIANR